MHCLVSLERVDHVSNGLHCIVLLSSSFEKGVLDPRMMLFSLRNRDPATVKSVFHLVKYTTYWISGLAKGDAKNWIVLQKQHPPLMRGSELKQSRAHPVLKRDKRRVLSVPFSCRNTPLMWQAPVQVSRASFFAQAAEHNSPVKIVLMQLS